MGDVVKGPGYAVANLRPRRGTGLSQDPRRNLRNFGAEEAVLVITGGRDGYVGRDGHMPEGEERGVRPIASSV